MLESCRVCGINEQDEKCESFLTLVESDKITPSVAGYLYEELMDLPVLPDNIDSAAILLCYGCYLQMKLFKKFKERARRTMLAMQKCFQKCSHNETNAQTYNDLGESMLEYLEDEGEQLENIEVTEVEENIYTDVQILEEAFEDVTNDNSNYDKNDYDNYENSSKENKKIQRGYDCFCCNQHFAKRNEYRLHRLEIHGNKYACTTCTKVFSTADALRVHQKLHSAKAQKYKCELCAQTFNQKVHLNYHLNRHNNVRCFRCEVCDKAFLSRSDLNIHMRTHTGEKRYICSICGKKFLLFQHLKMHLYSHNGEKAFECDICKYRFISPATLKAHQKYMHTELKFECEFCERKFRRKKNLQVHYKIHEKQMFGAICEEEVTEQIYELHSRLQEECVDDIEDVTNFNNLAENLIIEQEEEEEDGERVDDFFISYAES